MGYTNRSKDGRWGLTVGLLALILGLVLFGGISGPAPAIAAAINCGDCHSMPPLDSDSVCAKQTTKNHPAHATSNKSTCDRCHPSVADATGHPTAVHDNNITNITSVVAPGLRVVGGVCTNSCHKNQSSTTWGAAGNCNLCHYRSGASGGYTMSGLHEMDNRSWKHYSSTIKVNDNTKVITCSDCHPVNNADNTAPRAHINTTSFVKKASMTAAFRNVTVTGIGYAKGASQGIGSCVKSCHYNPTDPFGNRTIYFKPGQKKRFGTYQSAKWNDLDLGCNECHSTPGQQSTYMGSSSTNANKRHSDHMFRYKLNPWNFQGQDKNIYCDDCHKTPDIYAQRGFLKHSTLGKDNSKVISLPVKSQYSRVYMLWRNNGVGRDKVNPPSYVPTTTTCNNIYCHTIMASGTWTEEACDSCHGSKDGVNIGSGAPGYRNWTSRTTYRQFEEYSGGGGAHYSHVTRRGYPCRTCHYDGGGDGDPAKHHNVSLRTVYKNNVDVGVQPQFWFNNQTSKYNRVTRACDNVKCHYGASQNWDCSPVY